MLPLRVATGTLFTEVLNVPLPFKIPIVNQRTIDSYPDIFQYGLAEYESSLDPWLEHKLLSFTSEQAVVILDGMWQTVVKSMLRVKRS